MTIALSSQSNRSLHYPSTNLLSTQNMAHHGPPMDAVSLIPQKAKEAVLQLAGSVGFALTSRMMSRQFALAVLRRRLLHVA